MIILEDYNVNIHKFISEAVEDFKTLHGNPDSIGIYCCPWAGWISINFNLTKSIQEAHHNCPDFEFVEFAPLDLPEWQNEYESSDPNFRIGNTLISFEEENADEELNINFFSYLLPIMKEKKNIYKCAILLQFLDSNCCKVL